MARLTALLACAVFLLAGCGGDSDDNFVDTADTVVDQPAQLSGTAAAGAAILGQVIVKGAGGKLEYALIESDGSFTIDVSELTPPYRLRAEGRVGGREYRLHSYVESAEEGQVVNITPFTDLIVANAAGQLAASYFENNEFAPLAQQDLDTQEKALRDKLAVVLNELGVDAAVNLLHTAFSADHTGLDAALDMIRVEIDETTNIATLKNVITAETIEDNLKQADDNQGKFVDKSGVGQAKDDFVLIGNLLKDFSELFVTSLPEKNAIAPYFAETFLEEDVGKQQVLDEIVTEPENLGLKMSHPTFISYDAEKGFAKVTIELGFANEPYAETLTWELLKNEQGQWQFNGDRVIVDYGWNFHCNAQSHNNFEAGCGINIGVEDIDPSNTPDNPGTLITAAKFYTVRDGNTVPGSTIYLSESPSTPGVLWVVYQGNYQHDWMSFDQIDPASFAAGDTGVIELYTSQVDLNDPMNPVISGDSVQVIEFPIMINPVTEVTRDQLPLATESTLAAFEAYQGGELNIEWSMPNETVSSDIWLTLSQLNNYWHVDDYIVGGKNSVKLTLDETNLQSGDFDKELRIYVADKSGYQLYSTFYQAQGQIQYP